MYDLGKVLRHFARCRNYVAAKPQLAKDRLGPRREKEGETIPKTYTLFGKVLIAMARLEIQGISQGFGEVDVLRDVTLDVESGEIACLLGPSGCGKTTLFHVISGLASPRAGRVLLDGENITGRPGRLSYMLQKDLLLQHKRIIDNVSLPLVLRGAPVEEARSRAAELFGVFGLEGTERRWPSELSGGMRQRAALLIIDNVSLPLVLRGAPVEEARSRAAELFGVFGLEGTERRWPSELSGGRRQRAALLRSYLFSQEFMLLDEPFSALDAFTKADMHTWVLDVAERMGTTALVVTHDIDEALTLADEVFVMRGNPQAGEPTSSSMSRSAWAPRRSW